MLTRKGIEAIRERLKKATPGPWEWTVPGSGLPGPQLQGHIEAPEFNPILVTSGCGNDTHKQVGETCSIKGCVDDLEDELRACPLHPSKNDRDFMASAYQDIEALLDYIDGDYK